LRGRSGRPYIHGRQITRGTSSFSRYAYAKENLQLKEQTSNASKEDSKGQILSHRPQKNQKESGLDLPLASYV